MSTPKSNQSGGGAGMMEALVCHPFDTIKVRMQLSRRGRQPGTKARGFIGTGAAIIKRETPLGLQASAPSGSPTPLAITSKAIFLAGLSAGVTEAVAVVTPMEVIKIRLQAQQHSMSDPTDVPKCRNAGHALFTVVREEGFGALYRGVSLTALRQGTNQAANFTAYTYFKEQLYNYQPEYVGGTLPGYQTTLIGLVSGAMGPFSNAPIDTIKTWLQKTPAQEGVSALQRITRIAGDMFRQEGVSAFYKGVTPRVMRVAPGQAVTFTVYEFLKAKQEKSKLVGGGVEYSE
ncbi:mitochondrial carrier domain-containing protein [Bombardia bombarda]|uniref:Mitochondrial carrier domain-containing protein n=1 Tax=Bombardia bombarda TaxID=252184 RepID=A0AA39XJP4_9PEZI|nr:mitochondrial carrier domain-containing protein [Bombardia bombarda]